MAEWDFRELTELEQDLLKLSQTVKNGKHAKSHLRKTGTKLRKHTLDLAKSSVKKDTGNLFKGIKRGKPYKYRVDGSFAIRVYAGKPAYHAHLIDRGHRLVRNGKEVGFVEGKHFFEGGANKYEPEFYKDTEDFIDELLDDHGFY